MRYAVVLMVDNFVVHFLNMCDNLRLCIWMVDDTVDGKDNLMKETIRVGFLLSALLFF